MVAVIQEHFDPWHPQLLNKTEIQLDAILEAYADTFPNKLKFKRTKDVDGLDRIEAVSLEWDRRLTGRGKAAFRKKISFDLPSRFKRQQASQRHAASTQASMGKPNRQVRSMPTGVVTPSSMARRR